MRKFLVVLDDSKECLNAMRFAAMRAQHTGGDVEILSVIPPDEFNHWIGVGTIMREEAKERIHAHFQVFAKWMRDKHNVDPKLVIREGNAVDEILKRVEESSQIGVVVLICLIHGCWPPACTVSAIWPAASGAIPAPRPHGSGPKPPPDQRKSRSRGRWKTLRMIS
ncbi:MAG: universal stress protein [Maritimibacter sp.]